MLYKQEYEITNVQENIELTIYSALCFFVPFLVSHPQFIVGTVVNCALVLGALNLRSYRLLPIILLPSLGVIVSGAIFSTLTKYLIIMVPFIWAGNFILVYSVKRFMSQRGMLLGSFVKSGFLFISAVLLVLTGFLPEPFLVAMGPLQLGTALAGGYLAIGIQAAKKHLQK